MKNISGLLSSAIEAIGNTPLVELSRLTRGIDGRILAKLEYLNPGYSKKDRIARQIIEDAETSGELRPGQTVVELTSRTYANIFGLVERFIAAKVLDVSREHSLGDQNALEALVRFGDEEIKHQELFRRVERLCAEGMPAGYTFVPEPNAVASAVLSKSTWAVLALTCHIELFVLAHYRESIAPRSEISELWKDVFLYHWKEESQHAVLDELEWRREHAKLTAGQTDQGVTELIELVGAVDGLLRSQARADADYFVKVCGRTLSPQESEQIRAGVLAAYRWQYIVSGMREPRFGAILASMITENQSTRIADALAPIMHSTL